MKYSISFILFFISTLSYAQPNNVNVGIFSNSNDETIDVRIIADDDFNGIYSNVQFTLRWKTEDNITINNTNYVDLLPFNNCIFINKAGGVATSGIYSYQRFAGVGSQALSVFGITIISGGEFLIAKIPYSINNQARGILTRADAVVEIADDPFANDDSFNGEVFHSMAGMDVTGSIYQGSAQFSTLPIALSEFTAQKAGDRSVQLDWTSLKEVNASHFVVQRSDDGKTFFDLGEVRATGNTSVPIDYQYLDRDIQIQRNSSQVLYYRLKQVDLDGFTELSPIKAVRLDRLGIIDVSIYPNPTSDLLHLDISEDVKDPQLQYEILDVNGKRLRTSWIDASQQRLHLLELQNMGLQSGIYFIRLRNDKELLSSHKFVLISR